MSDLNKIESSDIVMQRCVDKKLNASLEQYKSTMKNLYNYVLSRSNIKVIKALSKVKKFKEREDGNKCS